MSKPFDVGVFIGRFQHIHVGHEFAINMGLSMCDRMLILVGSAQAKGTIKNPFDIGTRIKMIEACYPDPTVVQVKALPDYSTPDDIGPEWGRHVITNMKQHLHGLMPDIFIYGNDQRRSEWFMAQLQEVREVTEIIVARERMDISATTMREWMFLDEFAKWAKYANPKLRKYYDELRSELLNCKELEASVRRNLRRPHTAWTDKTPSVFEA